MGIYYDRLRRLMGLPLDTGSEADQYKNVLERIELCQGLIDKYQQDPGMTGETRDAAIQWLSDCDQKLQELAAMLAGAHTANTSAIGIMQNAKAQGEQLSPVLMSHWERSVLRAESEIWVDGRCYTGAAYAARLEQERENERENQAIQILGMVNRSVPAVTITPGDPTELTHPGTGNPSENGKGSQSSNGNASGLTLGAAAGGAAGAMAGGVGASQLGTGALSGIGAGSISGASTPGKSWVSRVPSTGPGSRSEPINDPKALENIKLSQTPVNPRMTPDGPRGGYIPAPVDNRDDPRWGAHYSAPGFKNAHDSGSLSNSGVAAGGMLAGAGGTLAARMAGGVGAGMSQGLTLPTMATGMQGSVPAGGMLRPGGVGASGFSSSSIAGTAPSAGAGAGATGQAAAAQASQASRGGMGRPFTGAPPAGAGEHDEEEQRSALHGYEVFRLDEEAAAEQYHHPLMDAGSVDAIEPVEDPDSDDQW